MIVAAFELLFPDLQYIRYILDLSNFEISFIKELDLKSILIALSMCPSQNSAGVLTSIIGKFFFIRLLYSLLFTTSMLELSSQEILIKKMLNKKKQIFSLFLIMFLVKTKI